MYNAKPSSFLLKSALILGFVLLFAMSIAQAATLPVNSVVRIIIPFDHSGSGFVIDTQKGYILTNAHVVLHEYTNTPWDSYQVCVTNASDQQASCDYEARLRYADVDKDLALVQIIGSVTGKDVPAFNKPAIDIQNAKDIEVGENITVLGFPGVGGTTITATQGVASGYKTIKGYEGIITSVIKTDASVMQGVSGGLVLDSDGNFVGIPSGYSEDENSNKIGIIITAGEVKNWFNKVITEVAQTNFSSPKISSAIPAEVSGIKIKKLSNTSVELSWAPVIANAPIDYYMLTYDSSEIFGRGLEGWDKYPNYTKIPANNSHFTIVDLDPAKVYYLTMAAVDTKGNESPAWAYEVTINMLNGKINDRIFFDVGEDQKYALAIRRLKDYETINGYPDGTFRANGSINRAELIKMIVLGQYNEITDPKYKNCFPDVKDEWFAPYICFAKEKGWISGYEDNTFRPSQSVNYAEALKIILKAYNMPTNKSLSVTMSNIFPQALKNQWYTQYIAFAWDLSIIPENIQIISMDEKITRGKIAEILYRTIVTYKGAEDYSSTAWKDSEDEEINAARYYGLKEGSNEAKFTYKVSGSDGTTKSVESTISKGCKVSQDPNCYTLEEGSETDEIRFTNDRVQILSFIIPTGSGEYIEPLTTLAKHNFVQYFRYKNPLSIDVGQYTQKFYDGVLISKFIGNEKINTSRGDVNAVKIEQITKNFGALTIDEYTKINLTALSTETRYFVKDIGLVRSTIHTAIYMGKLEVMNTTIQRELN